MPINREVSNNLIDRCDDARRRRVVFRRSDAVVFFSRSAFRVVLRSKRCFGRFPADRSSLATPFSSAAAQILRQRKLEVDRRTLLVDAPLATFGDHDVPLWVDASVAPTQRTLTVRVEPKR